jgi:hypothetical protein
LNFTFFSSFFLKKQIWSLDSGSKNKPVYSEKCELGFSSLAWLPARDKDNCGIDSARKVQENFILAWFVFISKHFIIQVETVTI